MIIYNPDDYTTSLKKQVDQERKRIRELHTGSITSIELLKTIPIAKVYFLDEIDQLSFKCKEIIVEEIVRHMEHIIKTLPINQGTQHSLSILLRSSAESTLNFDPQNPQ